MYDMMFPSQQQQPLPQLSYSPADIQPLQNQVAQLLAMWAAQGDPQFPNAYAQAVGRGGGGMGGLGFLSSIGGK